MKPAPFVAAIRFSDGCKGVSPGRGLKRDGSGEILGVDPKVAKVLAPEGD